jgi:uncharacterized protein YkwD
MAAFALLFVVVFTQGFLFPAHAMGDRQVVRIINECRRSHGLKPLRDDPRLMQSSRLKVIDMTRQGYFDHTSPAGEPFHVNFRRVGYTYGRVGEVLAGGCENERCVLDVWLRSPPHRESMLSPAFQDIGCSSARAPDGRGFYVVCHFGRTR